MAEVGITYFVKDNATVAMGGIADASKASLRSVRQAADGAKRSFEVMGGVATALNQSLELARKGWELMRLAVVDNIAEALRFREAGDPVLEWFSQFKRDAELTRAAIGDALIPVVQTLAESFGLVGDGLRRWIQENRKMIASGILEWVLAVSQAMVKGLLFAINVVSKAWFGWRMVIEATETVVNRYFEAVYAGYEGVVRGFATIASALGLEVGKSMDSAAAKLGEISGQYGRMADDATDATFKVNSEMAEFENRLVSLQGLANQTFGRALVDGMERIQRSITGTTKTIEEQNEAMKKNIAIAETTPATTEAIAAAGVSMADQLTAVGSAVGEVTGAIGSAFSAAGDDTGAAIAGIIGTVIEGALSIMTIMTSQAAGAAFAGGVAQGGGGPSGLALGLSVMASAIGTMVSVASAIGSISAPGGGGGSSGGQPTFAQGLAGAQMPGLSKTGALSQGGDQGGLSAGQPSQQSVTINNNVLVPDQLVLDRVTRRQAETSQRRLSRQGIV